MPSLSRRAAAGLAALVAGLPLAAAASCGSAFCLVNTDWSMQGVYTDPGTRLDLRYEYVNLDQPRHGRDKVSVGQIPRHHDEIETRNRNWIATLDGNVNEQWGWSVAVPLVDREHQHVHNHQGAKILDAWDFSELGDVRAQGRYQFFTSRVDPAQPRSAGLTFGLKLPTGKHDVTNGQGAVAERPLQPGTGTTDLLLGLYVNGAMPLDGFSWFAQASGVAPLNERDGFKPGAQLVLDGGVRYAMTGDFAAMLQLNYQAKARDKGVEAEPEDSGQRQVFLTPGVSWAIGRAVQLYAYVQVPLYQSVNGVQLTADWSAMAGVSWRF
ncbi:transporter [Usitatibacter palustris]|uniref:MetA-pathway of phenol degradation n=1 Tax=Usitatibacter palustris TaxID=2732487 RepID=A0A6M4HBM1_9PROT|nr:transporter [Usitatibacter palustris]QJR16013.1 hypothetical protein DSM104440_02841 [Usitatibacter palustris]